MTAAARRPTRPKPVRLWLLALGVWIALMPAPARSQTNEPAPVAARPVFFTALPDIPVMPGMEEIRDQAYIFDVPEGRIIESLANLNDIDKNAVLAFYDASLPQLGWIKEPAASKSAAPLYKREQERLTLDFETLDGQSFLKLRIAPLDERPAD